MFDALGYEVRIVITCCEYNDVTQRQSLFPTGKDAQVLRDCG